MTRCLRGPARVLVATMLMLAGAAAANSSASASPSEDRLPIPHTGTVWLDVAQPEAPVTTTELEVVVSGRAADGASVRIYRDDNDDGEPDGEEVARQHLSPEARFFEFHVDIAAGGNEFIVQAERGGVLSPLATTPIVTRVAVPPPPEPIFHPGLVQLRLDDVGGSSAAVERLRERLDREGIGEHHFERFFPDASDDTLARWYLLRVRPGQEGRALRAIGSDRSVEAIERPQLARAALVPNDPLVGTQPHLNQIEAIDAWDHGTSGPGTTIAVLDTQFDQAHPDLGNAAGPVVVVEPGCRVNFQPAWHGTAVTGVAVADTDNGVGIAGVGFNAQWLGYQLGVEFTDPNTGAQECHIGGTWPQALQQAVNAGADVVNMSFTLFNPANAAARDAIRNASNRGVLLVAAAGNEGLQVDRDPAALPEVMSVGAMNGGARAAFSNWGGALSVMAPGVNIPSTRPFGDPCGALYCQANGTSFAAPMVAGGGALVGDRWGVQGLRVRHRIEDAADDVPLFPGDFNNDIGNGELNLERAMTERVIRLAGLDRQRTAGEIAREAAPVAPAGQAQVVNTIVLVNAAEPNGWIDTLASGPLLNRHGAVYVSTRPNQLDDIALNEINRLFGTSGVDMNRTILIPGGPGGSIAANVENDLRARFTVQRIAGVNRYATAAAIAQNVMRPGITNAVITRGDVFADALAMAGVAARHGYPMLFVDNTDTVPTETCDFLRANPAITSLDLAGGAAAIRPAAASQLASSCGGTRTVRRQGGVDRFDTAIQIAQQHFPAPDGFVLAYGFDWPDAIAAAGLSRVYNAPVLLTDYEPLHPSVSAYVGAARTIRPSINIAWVLGGAATKISRAAEDELESRLAPVLP